MIAYILRRLLLVIPTLLGIMVVNFAIVQVAPVRRIPPVNTAAPRASIRNLSRS